MDARDLLDALQFKDQRVFHKHIDSVAAVQPDALVVDRLRVLKAEGDAVQLQFVRQALFIRGFEQARPKFPVNLDRAAEHAVRERIEFHPS